MSSPARSRSRTGPPPDNDTAMDTTARPANGDRSPSRTPSNRSRTPRSRSRSRGRSYTRSASRSNDNRSRSLDHPRSAKIVIEKLTKNVNSSHLREIFSTYGPISELEMPLNPQFMMNKGIAYILYENASYAENAIAHMHEAQLDGAVINVSIVLPRRRFSRSPPMKRPPPDRFGEPHRLRQQAGPPGRGGGLGGRGDRAFGGGRGLPPRASPGYGGGGRRSPPPRYGGGRGGGIGGYRDRYDDRDGYHGRSPPPRRRRSPSYDSRSRSPSRGSRSPPPRRRDYSPPPRRGGGGGGRRRSPSYDSYSSRSRSRSRDRGGRRR